MAYEPITAPAYSAAKRLWFNKRLQQTAPLGTARARFEAVPPSPQLKRSLGRTSATGIWKRPTVDRGGSE